MNNSDRINKYSKSLGQDWIDIENILEEALSSSSTLVSNLNTYLLTHSGKKLRPLLGILAAKACAKEKQDCLKAKICAAVGEIIHTATLLHDDVVDNSNLRRSVPTVKSLLSPGASVLIGDYWLSKAIYLLIHYHLDYPIIGNYAESIELLSEGEIIQMEKAEELNTTKEDYYRIIRRKTATLFISTIKSAVQTITNDNTVINKIEEYALNLGLAFQIRDDILDYQPSKDTGKDQDSDLAERKITLPLLEALKQKPNNNIKDLLSQINISTKNIDIPENSELIIKNNKIIFTIKKFVLENKGIEKSHEVLTSHINKAIFALKIIPNNNFKTALIEIANSLTLV
ncbi:MAG: polyprenyl synthetase family protein [Bacteroidales bacterium]